MATDLLKNRDDLKDFLKRASVVYFFSLLEIVITLKIETLIPLKVEFILPAPEQNKSTHKGYTFFRRINTKGIFVENLRRYMSQRKESLYSLYNFEVICASEIPLKKCV